MLRYRMNKIIKLMEQGRESDVIALVSNAKYKKAIQALADTGSVKLARTMGGVIVRVFLLDHYATYQLERHDIWFNRILGFLFGVGTSVLAAIILGLLPELS